MTDTLIFSLERIGRALVDLGFGGFLEKFENHFGKGLTKALLVLIGLAVASVCGSIVWTYLLLPITQMIPDPRSGGAFQFAKLVLIVAIFLMITNQLLQLFDNFVMRRLRKRYREEVERAEKLMAELIETREITQALHDEVADNNAASRLVLDEAMAASLERGLITPEQAAELRAMLEREPSSEARPA
jgi:hypothetical protein